MLKAISNFKKKPGKILVCPSCKEKIAHDDNSIPKGTKYEIICPKCYRFIKLHKKTHIKIMR